MVDDRLGQRVQEARTLAGLRAADLDRLADLSRGHTRVIEIGRDSVDGLRIGSLCAIAQVFGMSLDYLVTGKGERPSAEQIRASVRAAERRMLRRKVA